MPIKIVKVYHPDPKASCSVDGERIRPDQDGAFEVDEASAKVLVETHGFLRVKPATEKPAEKKG